MMVTILRAISENISHNIFNSKVILFDLPHCVMIMRILPVRNLHCTLNLWGDPYSWKIWCDLKLLGTCSLSFIPWIIVETMSYSFGSFRSIADLLTVVSDRIARAFNRSGATRAVALDISKAFDRSWYTGFLHKLKSH